MRNQIYIDGRRGDCLSRPHVIYEPERAIWYIAPTDSISTAERFSEVSVVSVTLVLSRRPKTRYNRRRERRRMEED